MDWNAVINIVLKVKWAQSRLAQKRRNEMVWGFVGVRAVQKESETWSTEARACVYFRSKKNGTRKGCGDEVRYEAWCVAVRRVWNDPRRRGR